MIRSTLRRVPSAIRQLTRREKPTIPYDMFDRARTEGEIAQARRLEKIYHNGQERVWDGKDVLAELTSRHGPIALGDREKQALRSIFAVILWGELAAWKVSAQLALELEPLEAKLAATAQAHDEARHFYVMHDYLDAIGYQPGELPPAAAKTLHGVLSADQLVKKLMGMQLMVEPVALTIFQLVRERHVEPVLTDLLSYYERDEARHVALGVNHLPAMIRGLTLLQAADLWTWQLRMFELEMAGMRELQPAFDALGIPGRDVLRLGMAKQLLAFRMTAREIGHELHAVELFKLIYDFRIEYAYPDTSADAHTAGWFIHAMRRVLEGVAPVTTTLTPEAA